MNSLISRGTPPSTTKSAGFSFMEVLISMLVLLVGIIGAMKMQLNSIQVSQQSNFYSTAVELASEMADNMRNRSNSMATRFANSASFHTWHFQSGEISSENTNECEGTHCFLDQLTNAEVAEWTQHIDAALPNARVVICRDSAPWNSSINSLTWSCAPSGGQTSVVIKLGWAEQNDASANPPPRFALAL